MKRALIAVSFLAITAGSSFASAHIVSRSIVKTVKVSKHVVQDVVKFIKFVF